MRVTPVVAGISLNIHPPNPKSLCVALVNAATFTKACKLDGSKVFQLNLSSPKLCTHLVNLTFCHDTVTYSIRAPLLAYIQFM